MYITTHHIYKHQQVTSTLASLSFIIYLDPFRISVQGFGIRYNNKSNQNKTTKPNLIDETKTDVHPMRGEHHGT